MVWSFAPWYRELETVWMCVKDQQTRFVFTFPCKYTFNHYIYWFNFTRVLIYIISKLSKRNLHNFPSNLLDSKRTDVSSGIITQIFVYRDNKLLTIRYNINVTRLLLFNRKKIHFCASFIHPFRLKYINIYKVYYYIIIIVSSSSTLTTIFVSFWRKLHFFTLMRFTFICKLFLTSKNVVCSYVCVYVSLYLCVRCRYTRKKWNNFCYLCTKSTSFLFSLPSFFFLFGIFPSAALSVSWSWSLHQKEIS